MISRDQILSQLTAVFEPNPAVLAMWEAGSASFGRVDEYSDIDLVLGVSKEAIPEVMTEFEAALEAISPIVDRYELPQPSWHGHSQVFYRIADTSPFLMIDVVFLDHTTENKFLEVEQHGTPLILFDKANVVTTPTFDWDKHRTEMEVQRTRAIGFLKLVSNLPEKDLLRGRPIDALHFYNGLIIRPLVGMLRMKHDPARYSFGLRYLNFDLPADVVERLQPLLFVSDPDDLKEKIPQALDWFWQLAEEGQIPNNQ